LIKQTQEEYYTFGGARIEKQQLKDLSNIAGTNPFLFCDINKGCIKVWRMDE